MVEYHKYSIKKNRFRRSFLSGMEIEGEHCLKCSPQVYRRMFVSSPIDGIAEGARWGRLHLDWSVSTDMVVTIYAIATDAKTIWKENKQYSYEEIFYNIEEPIKSKRYFMEYLGAKKVVNQKDTLLYELEGRFLYLMIDVQGYGEGKFFDIQVDNQGDLFMDTFPEIYHEYGGFFHRYLSIFSSLYMDFQQKIDNVTKLLDIDTAPAELLPTFGRWMGLDVSGDFLEENRLRLLIKEAYQLNRIKGTKAALQRVAEIVLQDKVIILEKTVLCEDTQKKDQKLYEDLYGTGIYDVTILIHTYMSEYQESQLLFLLNQFKPVRSQLKIRFLDTKGNLDDHTYMDMNAYVHEAKQGTLDERQGLDNIILLSE